MILKKSLLFSITIFIFCTELASNVRETKAKGYSDEDKVVALLYLWFTVCRPHTDISNVTCTFWKEIAISVRTSGSYTGIAEGSGLPGCNTMSMG
jgi:hypothetical protein